MFGDNDSDYRVLRSLIDRTPGDDEFARLKEDVERGDCKNVERAYLTFFLNRTTHNGLGTSGPLSDVASRYNAARHLADMDRLRHFKGRVIVTCGDFADCIAQAVHGDFVYGDPPYVEAGEKLYTKSHQIMAEQDHERLAAALAGANFRADRFMVSYDDNQKVLSNFNGFNVYDQPMRYSIDGARTGNKIKNELLITNFDMPENLTAPAGVDTSRLVLVSDK